MNTKHYIGLLIFSISLLSYGQDKIPNSVEKEYRHLSYIKSANKLKAMVDKGVESPEIYQKLGNAYYFNSKMEAASKWYGTLFNKYPEQGSEYLYRYAMSLKGSGDYKASNEFMKRFAGSNPSDHRAKAYLKSPNYLSVLEKQTKDFEVENLDINTTYSDFGTSFYNDGIVFASSRDKSEKTYSWNEQPYLELYSKQGGAIRKLKGVVNTKFHESSTSFTKDGETMYFTRNNYYKGKEKTDSEKTIGLKIYKATLKGGSWQEVTPMPFNSDNYNVAHPSLSADETQLYFTSDMPGTLGQSDLYVVSINEDGTYGEPKNLGSKINTEGRENFPYVSDNGTLYFSSDGHLGLGGLDVFSVDLNSKDQEVVNLGKPINSRKDDFGYIINEQNLTGYLTSNRSGGKGDDDIYRFKQKEETECMLMVSGIVKDIKTNATLSGSKVIVYNEQGVEVQNIETDEQGRFAYEHKCEEGNYVIKTIKGGFNQDERKLVFKDDVDKDITIGLVAEKQAESIGTDLATTLNLLPIYFNYDRAEIRPDAALELEKVVEYMNRFSSVKIDVRSHTDSRGNDSYNQALSQRRNQSTIGYLVNKGIDRSRLTGAGYGEQRLKNGCVNGVKCTESEHQMNRRSEFIIISR